MSFYQNVTASTLLDGNSSLVERVYFNIYNHLFTLSKKNIYKT